MADIPKWPYENFFGNPAKPFFPHSERMPYEMPNCEGGGAFLNCPSEVAGTFDSSTNMLTINITANGNTGKYILIISNIAGFHTDTFIVSEVGQIFSKTVTAFAGQPTSVEVQKQIEPEEPTQCYFEVITPPNNVTAINVRKSVLLHDLCGSEPSTVYLSGLGADISAGVIVYTDSLLTTPLLDYNYIDSTTGEIFVMNIETGEVIYTTGTFC